MIKSYQRSRERTRINKIRRFLGGGDADSILPPILPQNVVLNVRESFMPTEVRPGLYILPKDVRYRVVDGQHRIEAIMDMNAIPVPATITVGLDAVQEGALFLLINHTQKRVPAAVRLLNMAGMRNRRPRIKVQPLLSVLGLTGADLATLDVAAEQVLDGSHFWFDKVALPPDEER